MTTTDTSSGSGPAVHAAGRYGRRAPTRHEGTGRPVRPLAHDLRTSVVLRRPAPARLIA
ncbi:hypothetical protein [Streptomyces sp. NPDC002564]|uniref:hypothetical protein n=1 Tax=Streptomyces sp. NPDC002564 TaxID=3364649 RepID=UPI0036AB716F